MQRFTLQEQRAANLRVKVRKRKSIAGISLIASRASVGMIRSQRFFTVDVTRNARRMALAKCVQFQRTGCSPSVPCRIDVATFARTWGCRGLAHVLANVVTTSMASRNVRTRWLANPDRLVTWHASPPRGWNFPPKISAYSAHKPRQEFQKRSSSVGG